MATQPWRWKIAQTCAGSSRRCSPARHSVREDLADWLAAHGEPPQVDIASLTFTEDQVLGDWFPADPA